MTILNNDYTSFIKYCNNEIVSYESKNITNIRYSAFHGNNHIKSLSFPKVTTLDNYCFSSMNNLEQLNLPNVTWLGSQFLMGNSKIKSLSFPKVSAMQYGFVFDCVLGLVSLSMPNCTSIPERCFRRCESLTTLDFIRNVTYIGTEAFGMCYSLTDMSLDSLLILDSKAFSNCTNLRKIWIPSTCSNINAKDDNNQENVAWSPFYGCNSNCVIYTNATAPNTNWSNYWNYYDDTHKLEVCWDATLEDYENDSYRNKSTLENIVDGSIREIVYDEPMTALEAFGMAGVSFLHSISLKEITMIPMHYFEDCFGLKKITSESFPKLTLIRGGGFTSCRGLTEVDIPSVLQIEEVAFQDCNSLRKIWIPSTCTKLGRQLFVYATNLTVYTDASEKLNDWDENWNSTSWDNTSFATVKYNSTHDEYLAA